jgi:hypothetical protein
MSKYLFILFLVISVYSCGNDSEETGAAAEQKSEIDTMDALTGPTFLETFEDFVVYQKNLSIDIYNLDSLFLKYESLEESFTQEERDSSYFLYVDFMNSIAKDFDAVEDMGDLYDDVVKNYEPRGLTAGSAEGYLWLIVDTSVPGKLFKDDITNELYSFAMLGEITGQQHYADASMIEGYKEWGEMLIDLENRVKENKDSKYFEIFVSTYSDFLFWFMWGMDNTPIRGWEEGAGLEDEVITAYNNVIADDSHRTRDIIQDHMSFLNDVNFKYDWDDQKRLSNDEVVEYLFPQEIEE